MQTTKPRTVVNKKLQRIQSAQPRLLKQEVKQITIYSEKDKQAGKSIPKVEKVNIKKETVQPTVAKSTFALYQPKKAEAGKPVESKQAVKQDLLKPQVRTIRESLVSPVKRKVL